jgi:hypothetical protein
MASDPETRVATLESELASARSEIDRLRAIESYGCCCVSGSCACFTKRDPAWRAIPGNYPCGNCCDDLCFGCSGCGPDCPRCGEGAA